MGYELYAKSNVTEHLPAQQSLRLALTVSLVNEFLGQCMSVAGHVRELCPFLFHITEHVFEFIWCIMLLKYELIFIFHYQMLVWFGSSVE